MPAASTQASKHSSARALMVTLLTVVACVAVIRTIAPQTIGEQARRFLEDRLQKHYTECEVRIGRGTYVPGTGFIFRDLSIRIPTEPVSNQGWFERSQPKSDGIAVGQLIVHADVDPGKLTGSESLIETHAIDLHDVEITTHRGRSGQFSIASLWPPPSMGPGSPWIRINDTRVHLHDSDSPSELTTTWNTIVLSKNSESGAHSFIAKGEADFADLVELELKQTQQATFQASLKTRNARITSGLRKRLEDCLDLEAARLPEGNLLADVDATIQSSIKGSTFLVDVSILDGEILDPAIPSQIHDVRGRFQVRPDRISVMPSQASIDDAICRVHGELHWSGLQSWLNDAIQQVATTGGQIRWPPPVEFTSSEFRVVGQGLTLKPEMVNALPEGLARLWERWQPSGRLDVDLKVQRGATRPSSFGDNASLAAASHYVTRPKRLPGVRDWEWDLSGSVTCKGVDVRFDRFPYPVQQVVGAIKLEAGYATAEKLVGRAGGRRLHCGFQVPLKLHPDAIVPKDKTIIIQTEGAIPISADLIEALTPIDVALPASNQDSGLERFVRSLQPRGNVELAAATIQTDAYGKTSRQFDLQFTNASLRYEHFPYPLYNVQGRVQVQDDLVRLIGFNAKNSGAAHVACDGWYRMPAKQAAYDNSELLLRFRIADLALDQSLKASLPQSSRETWQSISPTGILDRLDVTVQRRGKLPLVLNLSAQQAETKTATARSLAIRPTAVPYRMDIIGGNAYYEEGAVRLVNIQGAHDAARLVADGNCVRREDGRWQLSLDIQSGSRLSLDEELVTALPQTMGQAMRSLDLRGPVGLRGSTDILLADARRPASGNWDILLQLEGNQIGDVGPVKAIRGEVDLIGQHDGQDLVAYGTAAIDSMHVDGLHLTAIRGPFSINGDELRLGIASQTPASLAQRLSTATRTSAASDESSNRRTPLVGRCFEGVLDLSGVAILSDGDFDVSLTLDGGKVAAFLSDVGYAGNDLGGRFDVRADIDGRLGDWDLLKGKGTTRLTDANLYQLPLIVQLLNLLSIKPTEDVAFTDGESEFTLYGEDVNFHRLQLWGNLVALDGGGTLSRQRHLDLSFNTRVSPQNLISRVISPLRDERYTLWTIDVDGPIGEPTISRHSLSGLGQTMETWFPGMVRQSTGSTLSR
ncbi:MAG: hypothetical protein AAGD07_12065 [Planctomycetota bacterium]